MFENLMQVKQHLEEINQMLMDPEIITDAEKYKNLTNILQLLTT